MSAAAAAIPTPPASGPGWIDVPEAARRGGWNEGHVGRLCRSTWAARGLARLEKPEDGGKPRWLVHETADVRLARVKTAAVLSAAFDPTHSPRPSGVPWRTACGSCGGGSRSWRPARRWTSPRRR
jgi:hypothetical protein